MTEDQPGQQCLAWFVKGGWEIAHGPDLAPDGAAPERDDKVVHDQAFLVDFGDLNANRFRAINQFALEGSEQLRRPDVISFINGLPWRCWS